MFGGLLQTASKSGYNMSAYATVCPIIYTACNCHLLLLLLLLLLFLRLHEHC